MFPARRAARAPACKLASCSRREGGLVGVERPDHFTEDDRLTVALDPAAHQVADALTIAVGVERALQRSDHTAMGHCEHGVIVEARSDVDYGGEDARRERLARLAS